MANKMKIEDLHQRQSLPLEAKILMTQRRIRDWYNYWDGNVYVSFSGGKDSTVLLHLVRSMYPEVPAVYSDTGLEFPEIREFVKTFDNVTWLKPAMNFRKVIETHGYPVISKHNGLSVPGLRPGMASLMLLQKRYTDVGKTGIIPASLYPLGGESYTTRLSKSRQNAAMR